MDDDEIVISAAAFMVLSCGYKVKKMQKKKKRCSLKKQRKRRWWMLSIHQSRELYNGTNLMVDLLREPSGQFENFSRMSSEDFNYLLNTIGPQIAKKDTKMRKSIPPLQRFLITLRFLATGDSFQSLYYLFKVSPQIISDIIPEVCSALIKALKDYIKVPSTADEWKSVSQMFEIAWNFPNCLGALDGKQVVMQCPINSGSELYNYKQNFSIVLMALVDAEYCFLFADCGCQGRLSDGAVFRNTQLFKKIENNNLNWPPDEPLKGRNKPVPYVFVGDDAFGLSRRIMKPYPGQHDKGSKNRIYNYRLSRARRIVENTFGIMASVFRVLRKPMLLQPDKVASITMTCVPLHNFLRKKKTSRTLYTPPGTFDSENDGNIIPGSWRQCNNEMSSLLPLQKIPRKPGIEAKEIRDEFADYFISNNGRVEWQDQYC